MKLKKAIGVFVAIVMIFALCLQAFAATSYVFTVQPKGGEASNNQPFTFTWETNVRCNYLLQSRDDDTSDWGNIAWISSPYSLEMANYTAQYRIMATDVDYDIEFYSNIFTITWKPAEDSTQVSMSSVEFADLVLGYKKVETLPITVTNVGAYTLRKPTVFMGDGSDQYFEIVQNKNPHDLLPGESDNRTWSIRPKKGLGIGYYHEYFYLNAENIAEYASSTCDLWVNDNAVELTYSMDADGIDFGTHEEGYGNLGDKILTVRATGTGNLTKVHIKTDSANPFFSLKQNLAEIDNLPAGTDTGTNWYVYLNDGLAPGNYSTYILVYAAEITDPIKIKISAKITAKPVSESSQVSESSKPDESSKVNESSKASEPSEVSSSESSEISSVSSADESSAVISDNSSEEVTKSDPSEPSNTGNLTQTPKKSRLWLIIAIIAAVILIIILIILILTKSDKDKDDDIENGMKGGAGSPFGVTFDGNAGCSGGDTVDGGNTAYPDGNAGLNGMEYGADGFNNSFNAGAEAGYTDGSFISGDNTGYTGYNDQNNFYNGN